MNSFASCFDIVSIVVDEATNKFAPIWKPDDEKYNELRQYCDNLDKIANGVDCKSFDVEVDDVSMDITITIECSDIIVESSDFLSCDLITKSVRFVFSLSKRGLINISLVLPSIWEKVKTEGL